MELHRSNPMEWNSFRVTHCNAAVLHNKYPYKKQFIVLTKVEPEVEEVQFFVRFSGQIAELLKGFIIKLLQFSDFLDGIGLKDRYI
jgi:hypothetical protein